MIMQRTDLCGEPLFDTLDDLYREVDRRVERLRVLHAARLRCRRGCSDCCEDGLTVFEVEARHIQLHCADLLANGTPHPDGACAFLDDAGACRIYPNRPYVCQTQGLPLRWIGKPIDGGPVELRDICPLNEQGPPVEGLPAEACWHIGPFEAALANLQATADGGRLRRVPLRALFRFEGTVAHR
ncbi:MAG: YkgJ family cysteine cluster protein [Acidobacteriota bacterium]